MHPPRLQSQSLPLALPLAPLSPAAAVSCLCDWSAAWVCQYHADPVFIKQVEDMMASGRPGLYDKAQELNKKEFVYDKPEQEGRDTMTLRELLEAIVESEKVFRPLTHFVSQPITATLSIASMPALARGVYSSRSTTHEACELRSCCSLGRT